MDKEIELSIRKTRSSNGDVDEEAVSSSNENRTTKIEESTSSPNGRNNNIGSNKKKQKNNEKQQDDSGDDDEDTLSVISSLFSVSTTSNNNRDDDPIRNKRRDTKRTILEALRSLQVLLLLSFGISVAFTIFVIVVSLEHQDFVPKIWILYGFVAMLILALMNVASCIANQNNDDDNPKEEEELKKGLLENAVEIIITKLDLPSETL